ncbi:hypothetical protein ABT300_28840 [Streptomyces sp. NPDC001027]|uniref:hypothetical protein n=1 Tax=Streptomyces sp. NPDC001027 TaxID=3154771 RepID=UPI003319D15C
MFGADRRRAAEVGPPRKDGSAPAPPAYGTPGPPPGPPSAAPGGASGAPRPHTAARVPTPAPAPAGPHRFGGGPEDPGAFLQRLERRHLDELARRLADPLGRLLRAEYLLGRERAGRLLDGGR